MKQVFSNSEVPHIWASQRQRSARNSQGNIYFEGKEIFSYGRHFCLGRILDNNIVLLCDRSYSNTTSKQQREVSYAVLYYNAAKDEKASEQLAAKLEKQRIAKEKAVTKQRVEREKKEREHLAKWIAGEDIQTQWFSNIENVFLRSKGEVLETSKGAFVAMRNAKRLFKLIQQGKDIKGIDIDGYTVIGINGVLTIGCHKIERTEINRFAALQGWGQIELH